MRRVLVPLFLVLLAACASLAYAQEDELLPADEAFAFEARAVPEGIEARWAIAEGYYMYRDKLSFALSDGSGTPIEINYDFPASKTKADPAFGDVEVYLKHADFVIPLGERGGTVTLTAKGQGCNEPVGVCYPPITHEIPLSLVSEASAAPQASTSQGSGGEIDSIAELKDLLGASTGQDDELLPPDEAFKVTAITDRGGVVVRFDVAEGYYLYRDKLKFQSQTHRLSSPQLPQGELKNDEYFGEQMVYKHPFDALVRPLNGDGPDTLVLKAQYQGCAEAGVCYPPQNKQFELSAASLVATANAAGEQPGSAAASVAVAGLQDSSPAQSATVSGSAANPSSSTKDNEVVWWVLITAFLAGIGLTFTPCVLPLIPILSSVIAGQGASLTKARATWLSGVYVMGTAVTYAVIGAVAGATGDQLQAYFQNVWAIGIMSAIFFIMALSMFGLFEIQMPSFIQSRLAERSQGIKGGSTPMVFVLGLLSALIVGACVSPVLISFLGIAISKGSATLGALIMFVMALGMGIPLILLGVGAGHLLPRAGMWMDKVKYVFGVMLTGVAIYLLSVLPGVPVLYLWAALLIIVAVYLGATQSLPDGASGWQKLFKGVGTLALVWGVLALVGALYGERDIMHPLPQRLLVSAPSGQGGGGAESAELFTRVNDIAELDRQMSRAAVAGKYVMLDYYADWCVDCVKMEKTTFRDSAVRSTLNERFVALQVVVTDPNDENRKALKKRYGVFGPPAVLFFDPQGRQIKEKSFYGYKNPAEFLEHLRSI